MSIVVTEGTPVVAEIVVILPLAAAELLTFFTGVSVVEDMLEKVVICICVLAFRDVISPTVELIELGWGVELKLLGCVDVSVPFVAIVVLSERKDTARSK